jgi:hypothetical protein
MTTKTEPSPARAIRIRQVGAVDQLEIPIPEGGGLVVLAGVNGAGKSTALDAVTRLGGGKATLAPSDGQTHGSVEGLGATLRVSRSITSKGTLEVRMLEGADPMELVDPRFKDPEARALARIRAICALAGVAGDEQEFASLATELGVDAAEVLADRDLSDAPGCARALQRAVFARALEWEKAAEAEDALGRGALSALDGQPMLDPAKAPDVEDAVDGARRDLAKIKGQREAAENASRSLGQAREALATAAETEAQAKARLHEASQLPECPSQAERDAAAEAVRAAQEVLAELDRQARAFEQAEQVRRAAAQKAQLAERDLAAARSRVEAFAELPTPPTDDELQAATQYLAEARAAAESQAAQIVTFQKHTAAMLRLERAKQLRAQAAKLRDDARQFDDLLAGLLGDALPAGMRISGLQLEAQIGRGGPEGWTDFDQLSFGERAARAIDIAVRTTGEGGLLVVSQTALEGLDPNNREALALAAKRHKVVLLSALPTLGPLRAELFGENGGAS